MTIADTLDSDDYRKSSFSGPNTNCVEVRGDLAAVRDSKNGAGLPSVNVRALVAFVTGGRRTA